MTGNGVTRRLAAILAADVAGYSRLMGADEAGTRARFNAHLAELIEPSITGHRGRIVKTTGDGLLVEFASVVDAVQCAVEIQDGMAGRNADAPDDGRMEFRIGVNLGDVIIEGDDIHGDGVNVAARLEGLAEPGGICVSGDVYRHARGKADVGFEDLGEQEVKNIADPVRVYRVLTGPDDAGRLIGVIKKSPASLKWPAIAASVVVLVAVAGAIAWLRPWQPAFEPASVERMSFPLPEKPSIAVLPFDNLSGDPKQDYLGDGMSENIITALSKIPNMFVIARNSTFTYKDKAVKVRQVAEELGVRYVLEGSVQRSGDRLRITAQLIDALGGHHLWAERYDREFKDIFALQDDVTRNVVTALQVELTEGEEARLWSRQADNPQAIEYYLRGREHLWRMNKAENAKAQRLLAEAVALAPNLGIAWVALATTHFFEARFGWSEDRARSAARATQFAQKALEIDGSQVDAYVQLSNLAMLQRNHGQAEAYCEKALALNPTANVTSNCARILTYLGRPREALPLIKRAMRLSPYYPATYLFALGNAHRMLGNYDEAIAALKAWRDRTPNSPFPYDMLAMTYAQAGRDDEARAAVAALLKVKPDFTLKWFAKLLLFKNPAESKHFLDVLRKLGVPENPPLKLPDRPSIAVLPFTNMSGDKQQEYFSDGITEDIITDLSKVSGMFVIARNSSFKYKGKSVDVRTVARDLGVRHILEGSVRKAGTRVRITAQLIDGNTGNHVWAERFDRELNDIFAVQDEVSRKVVSALAVTLTADEKQRLGRAPTANMAAYELFLQAKYLRSKPGDRDRLLNRRRIYKRVIELDPGFSGGYAGLSGTYSLAVRFGHSPDRRADARTSFELARKAMELDDGSELSHTALANAHLAQRRAGEAIALLTKALALFPNSAAIHFQLGTIYGFAGAGEDGVTHLRKSIRLNPNDVTGPHRNMLGIALFVLGRFHEAVAKWDDNVARGGPVRSIPAFWAAAYYQLGRHDEAKAARDRLLKTVPDFSTKRYGVLRPMKPAIRQRTIELFLKAGLPE